MFDDLIQKRPKTLSWDFEKYEKKPYCPICGCEDLTIIRDHLSSKKLVKDIKCNFCGVQWKEEWDKDIDLTLKEVSICIANWRRFWRRLSFGMSSLDV